MPDGKVCLPGAGPGAVHLITVPAAQVLATADVVIYDHLVNEELLNLAPAAAELIYAGKQGGGERALNQGQINQLMVDRARAGRHVVRLKAGAPFILGRRGAAAAATPAARAAFERV